MAKSSALTAQEDGKPEVLGVNTSRQFVSDASLPPAASRRRFFTLWDEHSNRYKPSINLNRFFFVVVVVVNSNGHTHVLLQTRGGGGLNNKTKLSEIVGGEVSESHKRFATASGRKQVEK